MSILVFPAPTLGNATDIINQIVVLLDMRKKLLISRRTFLVRYDKLRFALANTTEYLFIREQAFAKTKGYCAKCKTALATQLCHRQRVATHPRLALASNNVYAGCTKCHQSDHPQFKLKVANG